MDQDWDALTTFQADLLELLLFLGGFQIIPKFPSGIDLLNKEKI